MSKGLFRTHKNFANSSNSCDEKGMSLLINWSVIPWVEKCLFNLRITPPAALWYSLSTSK